MRKKLLEEFQDKASWLRKGVLYHRGKHWVGVKENTIKSFELAIKDNKGVELDVRLTKDGKVVVSHDDDLMRVYGENLKISESTYDEISKISKGEVPLFTQVLDLIDDKIPVMVEIKSNKVGKLEEEVYSILKEYKGRFVIVSFNPMSLRYFKKKDPSIIRGQLSYSYKDSKLPMVFRLALRRMWLNVFSCPHFISYGIDNVDYKLLEKFSKKGYFIIGWTYKEETSKSKLKSVYNNMIIENLEIEEF